MQESAEALQMKVQSDRTAEVLKFLSGIPLFSKLSETSLNIPGWGDWFQEIECEVTSILSGEKV